MSGAENLGTKWLIVLDGIDPLRSLTGIAVEVGKSVHR